MAKNTFILLGEYFNEFIREPITSGKFSSVSEVIRRVSELLEQQRNKKKKLIKELKKGERSGSTEKFNKDEFLNSMHQTHTSNQ